MNQSLKQPLKQPLNQHSNFTLDLATIGQPHTIRDLVAPASTPEWSRELEEIGFHVGEHVTLMARAMPGGDPLVVRIGMSTFALRRAEAACVRLEAKPEEIAQ